MPLLLAALVLGAPAAPAVETLGAALARLGATAAHEVAGIPVLVDASGLGAGATLRALAAATRSTVVADGRSLRLERTAADRKALVAAHRAALRARIVAGLAAWDRALGAGTGDVAAQVRAARARRDAVLRERDEAQRAGQLFTPPPDLVFPELLTPAARLLRAIVDRLGLDRLAALAPGEVRFLSDRPNTVETALPDCGDLVDAYLRAQTTYAKATGEPEPERPAKLVLILKEWQAGLGLYGADGRRGDGFVQNYGQTGVFFAPPSEPPAAGTPILVPLDEATRRLRAILYATSGAVARSHPSSLPEAYLHPERFDPLGFEVRAGLLALPRLPGAKATVAALSDGLLGTAGACVKDGRLDEIAFAWRLAHTAAYERSVQGGVEIVRPEDPLAAEAGTVDRDALGRGLRAVAADGGATLGNWPALHLGLFTGHVQPAATRYLAAMLRVEPPRLGTSLPDGEWALVGAAIQAGKGTARGEEPPFDRLLRLGVVQGWLSFERPPASSDLDAAPSTLLASIPSARLAFGSRSATVAKVYGGFDAKGPIRLEFEGADLERLRNEFGDAREPEALGADMALPRRFEFPGMPFIPISDDERRDAERRIQGLRYLLGNRTDLGIDILLGGLRARIEARDWAAEGQGTTFGDLPPAFREAVLRGARNALERAGR